MFKNKDLKDAIPADNGLTKEQNVELQKIRKIMEKNNFVFTVNHIVGIVPSPKPKQVK